MTNSAIRLTVFFGVFSNPTSASLIISSSRDASRRRHNEQSDNYLEPEIKAGLPTVEMKTCVATDKTLKGFGQLVGQNYENFPIEIVRWPAMGTRPIDPDTGDEGGTTEGIFRSYWKGDIL